ncbi:response regulator [Clostridium tyrobutyricum]|uniref:response regulator n=1 Tax=Clostridium tyrobutyricum TaxID=1519 RepID=UPI0020139C54|nr:response regulator [Clostridium tyrobutyricum]MBR9649461.1 response regulator [Clostridium tyrobutyricum]
MKKYWIKDQIVYPTYIKSLLYISYRETYEVLDIIKELGILEYNFEIYCSKCEKFQDFKILRSLNEFPEKLYCESGHKLDPLKDTVLIYRVIKDE